MEISLGTVQLGQTYGIANHAGKPSRSIAIKILEQAVEGGITRFDTAHAYGESESIIGEFFQLHPSLRKCVKLTTKVGPEIAARESLERSLEAMKMDYADVVLYHRWQERLNENQFNELLKMRQHFGELGFSARDDLEVMQGLKDREMRFIQLPMNLLDWRFQNEPFQTQLHSSTVHLQARSVLLQGILTGQALRLPRADGYDFSALYQVLKSLVINLQRESLIDLAYAYVRGQKWLRSCLVAVENPDQLVENFRLLKLPALTPAQIVEVDARLTPFKAPKALLNPFEWTFQ